MTHSTTEIHRTFKPSEDSHLGFLTLVFRHESVPQAEDGTEPPRRPDAVVCATLYPEAMDGGSMRDVMDRLGSMLTTVTGIRAELSRFFCYGECATINMYFDPEKGQGLGTLANALAPNDPDREAELQKAFRLLLN